jgi:non-ribosomal peptide synthetase component F
MTTTEIATIAPAIGGMDAGRGEKHEQARRLAGLNLTRTEFPSRKCVHHFFEEQARRTPDETAIVFAKDRLKFRELDQQANASFGSLRSRRMFRLGFAWNARWQWS